MCYSLLLNPVVNIEDDEEMTSDDNMCTAKIVKMSAKKSGDDAIPLHLQTAQLFNAAGMEMSSWRQK